MNRLEVDLFDPAPDPDLVCAICQCVLLNPAETAPCRHVFCRVCIETWLGRGSHSCPSCRAALSVDNLTRALPVLCNVIGRLSMRCVNSESGCEVRLTVERLELHLRDDCLWVVESCVCGAQVLRRDRQSHAQSCADRTVVCTGVCGLPIKAGSLEGHDCIQALKNKIAEQKTFLTDVTRQLEEMKARNRQLEKQIEELRPLLPAAVARSFPTDVLIQLDQSSSVDAGPWEFRNMPTQAAASAAAEENVIDVVNDADVPAPFSPSSGGDYDDLFDDERPVYDRAYTPTEYTPSGSEYGENFSNDEVDNDQFFHSPHSPSPYNNYEHGREDAADTPYSPSYTPPHHYSDRYDYDEDYDVRYNHSQPAYVSSSSRYTPERRLSAYSESSASYTPSRPSYLTSSSRYSPTELSHSASTPALRSDPFWSNHAMRYNFSSYLGTSYSSNSTPHPHRHAHSVPPQTQPYGRARSLSPMPESPRARWSPVPERSSPDGSTDSSDSDQSNEENGNDIQDRTGSSHQHNDTASNGNQSHSGSPVYSEGHNSLPYSGEDDVDNERREAEFSDDSQEMSDPDYEPSRPNDYSEYSPSSPELSDRVEPLAVTSDDDNTEQDESADSDQEAGRHSSASTRSSDSARNSSRSWDYVRSETRPRWRPSPAGSDSDDQRNFQDWQNNASCPSPAELAVISNLSGRRSRRSVDNSEGSRSPRRSRDSSPVDDDDDANSEAANERYDASERSSSRRLSIESNDGRCRSTSHQSDTRPPSQPMLNPDYLNLNPVLETDAETRRYAHRNQSRKRRRSFHSDSESDDSGHSRHGRKRSRNSNGREHNRR